MAITVNIPTSMSNMRSIWDNNFYNTPPALSWTYKLNFNDFVNFSIKNDKNETVQLISPTHMSLLNKAAVSINIGERKIENTDIYYGGLAFKVLTRVENGGSFTVKFNEDEDLTITGILETLYNLYGNNKFYFKSENLTNTPYANDMRNNSNEDKTVSVLNTNTKHNIISVKIFNSKCLNDNVSESKYKQYKFYNCKLLGIEGIDYDYESTDTIVRNATFSYDWMEYNIMYDNPNIIDNSEVTV